MLCVLMKNVGVGESVVRIIGSRLAETVSCHLGQKCLYSTRLKGTSVSNSNPNPKVAESSNSNRRGTFSPRITVISTDSTASIMTLEEAQRLSKRRDLKLIKVMDVERKTQRPVYKLMTGAEYFQEDLNRRAQKTAKRNSEIKDPKLVTLSSKISDHDLSSKIKNIVKWLNKRHEVRIVINIGENDEAEEHMVGKIETETKHCGKLVQKRKKGNDLKFQLMPLKVVATDSTENPAEKSEDATTRSEST